MSKTKIKDLPLPAKDKEYLQALEYTGQEVLSTLGAESRIIVAMAIKLRQLDEQLNPQQPK